MSEEGWPETRRLVALIEDRFDFLARDHGFERLPTVSPLVIYDLRFMSMLTRIRVAPDLRRREVEVDCSWPDEGMSPADEPPTISLGDIVAMRAPGTDVPT